MRPPPRPQKPKDFQRPTVVFDPLAAEGMQRGMDKLVRLVSPTLGPLPHIVAHEKIAGRNNLPEMLDSGGTIARRVIQIQNRVEDVGFMYLRHVLWKLQEGEGDGTASAAVMFQTIYSLGRRYLVAGGNPMGLRQHFEDGLRIVLNTLDGLTTQLQGRQALTGLARTICYDDELAKMLGEVFDIIGAYGRLEVRKGPGKELLREYVEGMYWDEALRSREMANAEYGMRANLENASILVTDLEIEEPAQLVPLLNLAVKHNIKQILLVSATLSDRALGILLNKANREKVHVVAVKTPGVTTDTQIGALEDLAILTGARQLLRVSGDRLEEVTLDDFGRARRIWADQIAFGIIGGRGEPRTMRQHIATLRETYRKASPDDRKKLLERLGKLMGGSATLMVGGLSPTAIDERVELAKRTADAMRGAMRDGVVPGGTVSFLACRAALLPMAHNTADPDQRAAYRIMLEALETPFRVLVENAGGKAEKLLALVEAAGGDCGYDVLRGKVLSMREAGIFDAAPVIKGAVRSAFSGAALALTTDAIVQRKNPPEGYQT
jgi:chaperonin GroEL